MKQEVEVKDEVDDRTVIIKQEVEENDDPAETRAAVSVVKSAPPPVYNSEIELSTDTEDSASEIISESRRAENIFEKIEELIGPSEGKECILELVKNLVKEKERLVKECADKDEKIRLLENENSGLKKLKNDCSRNNGNYSNGTDDNATLCNGDLKHSADETTTSSIIQTKNNEIDEDVQMTIEHDKMAAEEKQNASVIASLEPKAIIINTAPE